MIFTDYDLWIDHQLMKNPKLKFKMTEPRERLASWITTTNMLKLTGFAIIAGVIIYKLRK